MAIKLLTLDLDNTLWETDPVIARAEQASYDALITRSPAIADLYSITGLRDYKSQLAECYPTMAHQVSRLRLETLRRIALQAGHAHNDAQDIAEFAFDTFMAERSNLTLFEGARQALETLADEFPLIALTNGNASLEVVGLDHLFAAHFNAEEVGAAKPDAHLFNAALAHQQVQPHECLHIGDHPHQDIDAARTVGFHTVWVNVLDLHWPEAISAADVSIQHLSQLTDAVKRCQQLAAIHDQA